MKTLKFLLVFFAALGSAISCSDDKGFFDKDAIVYAAYLNFWEVTSPIYNTVSQNDVRIKVNNPSFFEMILEERDVELGKLFQSVKVYIGFKDNNTPVVVKNDVQFLEIPASDFVADPETGYPRYTLTMTATQALTALGLTQEQVLGGDEFELSFELIMKDGRIFSAANASSVVTGGSFFNSPYFYRVPVVCGSDRAGSYDVITTVSAYDGYYPQTIYENNCVQGDGCPPVTLTATSVTGQYILADLSGNLEPDYWGNPPVKAIIQDLCAVISLVKATQPNDKPYLYPYFINSGSRFFDENGVQKFTITWENRYGEDGVSVYTKN